MGLKTEGSPRHRLMAPSIGYKQTKSCAVTRLPGESNFDWLCFLRSLSALDLLLCPHYIRPLFPPIASMRSFLRGWFSFRSYSRNPSFSRTFTTTNLKMASSTAAALYALTLTASPVSSVPDDASKKAHHVKNGFDNPWEYAYRASICPALHTDQVALARGPHRSTNK
jgi:hypothetical protein